MRFGSLFREQSGLLPEAQLLALREAILASPYLGPNNLNYRFSGTLGFSIVFSSESTDEMKQHFPQFAPFVDLARQPSCNGFFLNPLVVTDGGGVEPHRDYSLHRYGDDIPLPEWVSVLYVQVPVNLAGGDLILYDDQEPIATITPRPNTLVTFRGHLRHAVTPIAAGSPDLSQARISLVMEQYWVNSQQLEGLPICHVDSRKPVEDAWSFSDALIRWLE